MTLFSFCCTTVLLVESGGEIVCGVFPWHTLGALVATEHSKNVTAYLSIFMDHAFIFTMYSSSNGYFQQNNVLCHKVKIISKRFSEHDKGFTAVKWPPQSPDLWDVVDRRFASWKCSRQIRSNYMVPSCQYGPKSLTNVNRALFNSDCKRGSNQFLARCT